MATLPETNSFDANVNRILTTDLVLGDAATGAVAGPANLGPQNLTNRTRWLFNQNTTNVANIAALTAAIATLAPLASPSFTGSPIAPTPGTADNSTRLATTAYVQANLAAYAPINSPGFTGFPTAPTQALGDSSARLATTAFVNPGSVLTGAGPWYRENPDGSIDQWGTTVVNIHVGAQAIAFGRAFPNACQEVNISIEAAAVGWDYWIVNGSRTVNGFQFNNDAPGAGTVVVNWRAIGR